MPDDTILIPTILPTGTLHFATVGAQATAKDVILELAANDQAQAELDGFADASECALQRIRSEPTGRSWEEHELEALGDGIIDPTSLVAPLLQPLKPESPKHFSSFPLTSHLHNPIFRLVSLNPDSSFTMSFLRVPEIHDDFKYKIFVHNAMTVKDVVDLVSEELGLAKSLPIPGGGAFEYVIEEAWVDGKSDRVTRLAPSSHISHIISSSTPPSPHSTRAFRFCIPEEWFRRSKSRNMSSSSLEPSESTLRRLAALQESDEEDSEEGDGDGTAKAMANSGVTNSVPSTPDAQGTFSQNRLSHLFEGWLGPSSPTPSTPPPPERRRTIVSEPKLLDKKAPRSQTSDTSESEESEVDNDDFEKMLDELNLKGDKRSAMHSLPSSRKRYLLRQNSALISSSPNSKPSGSPTQPAYAASYGPASTSALLPRLVPQLTGDSGLMRRLSMAGWGTSAPPVITPDSPQRVSGESDSKPNGKAQIDKVVQDASPLQPQTTGGIWGGWWGSAGVSSAEGPKTAKWYADWLRSHKAMDKKMVSHLISLRVHLSTTKVLWIEEFVSLEKGVSALGGVLATLVGKGGKQRALNDAENAVLMELTKCLRALLNTELGFSEVLSSPTIVTHIAYSLSIPSLKLRTLACELLAAICVVSLTDGYRAVLSALSDYRVAFDEQFRFETLLASLRLPDVPNNDNEDIVGFGNEEDGIWEARAATVALLNALTTCPESLEDRVLLREELTRRGLNEIIVALRYTNPPDALKTQLDVYTEEKFEDEEDMRERAKAIMASHTSGGRHLRSGSDSEVALEHLVRLAKQHGELYPMMLDILNHYSQILSKDTGIQLKADLFSILDKFVEQAALLDDFDDGWYIFMKKFAASVQHITGQEIEVKAVSDAISVHVTEEIETLRAQVEDLSEERERLRDELNQQVAEVQTLKSLPLNIAVPHAKGGKGGPENFHGLVQRLVQKEKQVLQLQTELDRFKTENPSEAREAGTELESSLTIREKEITYLKRALESVYTRFMSREEMKEIAKEAEMDAEQIANRAIERLTQKEEEISGLRQEISQLQEKLAARPKSEREFKMRSPPPPPPAPKPKPRRMVFLPLPLPSRPTRLLPHRRHHHHLHHLRHHQARLLRVYLL
ncbi:hypothetical protein ONZ45_g17814 [Pleurotus djamor]|nr:hypothetical protein ONZ45_g17814 [Pleurotus djamor]